MRAPVSVHLVLAGALSAVGCLPIFLSAGVPGYDSSSHVAKTAFLMYSFSHGNFSGWSQFWYSGFQLFYTYSPLTYLLAGGVGWPLGSAMLGMKVVLTLSFILSGVGAFALARDFGVSPNWSLIGALLYSLLSPHILIVFYTGSLTYGLAFALAPFLVLSCRSALRKQTTRATLSLGVLIALMILANATTAYVLLFPLSAYFLLSVRWSRVLRPSLVVAASLMVGFLLSGFWLIPYLEIQLSGSYDLLMESASGAFPPGNVIHWYSFFLPSFGNALAGDVGWILVLPALASLFFLREREEFAMLGAAVVSILMTIGPTITPLFYRVPLVLALEFAWRFLIADVLFTVPLASFFFMRMSRRFSIGEALARNSRKIVVTVVILLVVVSVAAAPFASRLPSDFQAQQSPSDPGQEAAYSFLSSQPGFFRVMVIDRYFEAFPQFTLKGSIDGWYDEATTQEYRNYTFNIYYCGAGKQTLGGLRLLGARYVMVDYAYGRDAVNMSSAYSSSTSVFGPPVFTDSEAEIYQVPDSSLVYVSQTMPNGEFGTSQDVDCDQQVPSAPTSQVNYTISNMSWGETRISFDVDVPQSSYVLVSNAYSSGWAALDNGSSTPILVSPPGLPVVHVSAGDHLIVLFYTSSPAEQDSAAISLVALVVVSATLILTRKERR